MLARALGASVSLHPQGVKEVGQCEIEPTAAGHSFLPNPLTVMQWHKEGFDLPNGATNLARSDTFENQAFRLNEKVYGVQFHPEVNPEALAIWHERNKKKTPNMLSDAERSQMMTLAKENDPAVSAWLDRFLTSWTLANLQTPNEIPIHRNG